MRYRAAILAIVLAGILTGLLALTAPPQGGWEQAAAWKRAHGPNLHRAHAVWLGARRP